MASCCLRGFATSLQEALRRFRLPCPASSLCVVVAGCWAFIAQHRVSVQGITTRLLLSEYILFHMQYCTTVQHKTLVGTKISFMRHLYLRFHYKLISMYMAYALYTYILKHVTESHMNDVPNPL